jgi:capsular exopolysaccharide synthesis family protein
MEKKQTRAAQYDSTLMTKETSFEIREAYKIIRTNLLFTLSTANSRTVIISSPFRGDGKSTTCANLSITMSQMKSHVLIIDADLRQPVQHKLFRVENEKGLSTLLSSLHSMDEVIHADIMPSLDLVSSGPIPPNPSELLGSAAMKQALKELNQRYDYIFIDSPPINFVTDAVVLSNQCAGIILVTRQGKSTHEELKKAIQSIEFSKSNIVGLVLAGVETKIKKYDKYEYGYGK